MPFDGVKATPVVSLDFETCSILDLIKTGTSRYARCAGTHILCMAYSFDFAPPELWLPGDPFPPRLAAHIATGHRLYAWNANFERQVWRHIATPRLGWPVVPLEQWSCSMAQGMYWGLPAGLDDAAKALGLIERKDQEGHRLMLQMSRPRSWRDGKPIWWADDRERMTRLAAYCMQDVVVEQSIAQSLPPLPEDERRVWLLDARMNDVGVRVDLSLTRTMQGLAAQARVALNAKIAQLTNRRVTGTNQVQTIQSWLSQNGVPYILDMKRDTLKIEVARPECPPAAREVMETRLDAARTSTRKLDALLLATDEDQRLRCTLRYYGAGRTGRWSGAGGTKAQLQNLPRPTIPSRSVAKALEMIIGGATVDDLELLFEDSPLGAIATCIRGCFVAAPGHKLVCADLAQIEARVIAWLAKQQDVLDVFLRHEDIYMYSAGLIGSTNRMLGKVIRLALAYGMGSFKFVATALSYGVVVGIAEAESIVSGFRYASPHIRAFWYALERDMMLCIRCASGTLVPASGHGNYHIGFRRRHDGVEMILPSGRGLFYRNARIDWDEKWERECICYDGLNQKTRQWMTIRTYGGKLAENATQAVARDVLVHGMLKLDALGHQLLLTSHDEIISEAPERQAQQRFAEMLDVMAQPIPWALGLPVEAEGFIADRYRK